MLTTCAKPGCDTFVLGGFCLEHESPQTRVFVRGRPFVPLVTATSPYTLRGRAPVEARRTYARPAVTMLVGAGRATVAD